MARDDLEIAGPRVRLRPVRDEDVPLMEPWYGEAAAGVHGLSDPRGYGVDDLRKQGSAARADVHAGLLVITRPGDDGPIGLLDYRIGVPEPGWAMIGCVVLAAGARRRGLGQEAVRAFEEEARRRWSVKSFSADVDVRHGLALYFWLRLGYRPLEAGVDSLGHEVLRMARGA